MKNEAVLYPAIFGGGAGFLTSIGRRKTVMQLESVGGDVSCIQWGPEAKPPPSPPRLALLHSE